MNQENFIVDGRAFHDPVTGQVQQVPSLHWILLELLSNRESTAYTFCNDLLIRFPNTKPDVPVRPIGIGHLLYFAIGKGDVELAKLLVSNHFLKRYSYVPKDAIAIGEAMRGRLEFKAVADAFADYTCSDGISYIPVFNALIHNPKQALAVFKQGFMRDECRQAGPQDVGLLLSHALQKEQYEFASYLVSDEVRARHFVLISDLYEILQLAAKHNHEDVFFTITRHWAPRPQEKQDEFWFGDGGQDFYFLAISSLAPKTGPYNIVQHLLDFFPDNEYVQDLANRAVYADNCNVLRYILKNRQQPFTTEELKTIISHNKKRRACGNSTGSHPDGDNCARCNTNRGRVEQVVRGFARHRGINLIESETA